MPSRSRGEPVLVDTNVISYFLRDDPLAERYRQLVGGRPLVLSFMTLGELYEGAFRAGWSPRRLADLDDRIRRVYRIARATKPVCREWARIRHERRARPISAQDAWIAACARAEGVPLVTHDARDFANIAGLTVLTAA
jgi:tRNA(fMet)-specific endonuclease VapC